MGMKIIDFKKKGNVIRFLLGEKEFKWGWTNFRLTDARTVLMPSKRYYGDDWNDISYEDNAGEVYHQFVKAAMDIYIPYDYLVLEPADSETRSGICKDDLAAKKYPCILIIPKELTEDNYSTDYKYWATRADKEIIKVFFEDSIEKLSKSFFSERYSIDEL